MPDMSEWLAFAPEPHPLPAGKKWHVFLSYRSVNRAWVLQLYDVLRHLDYQVFLDQYVLSAAAPLAITLGEELDASTAAIMIWSNAYDDSEWCRKEYTTLETLEAAGRGFRYLIAKLDSTLLPAFAAAKIYVEFADQREGPSGSGLLRMLYGLTGRPLPDGAIKLAAAHDQQTKDALSKVRAARAVGDTDRLLALAREEPSASSLMLRCEVADALVALKRPDAALPVLDEVQRNYPRALRPRQLRALALARAGRWQEAQLLLGELYAAGEIDPETLGLYGRTWMDRYGATGNRLYLLKSRDLYRQAFEAAPSDFYTGINAASKSLFLGERETAAQLASRVEKLVGRVPKPGNYWHTATVAEVQLLQRNYTDAASIYAAAVGDAPEEHGSHESTHGQAVRLLDALGASEADRKLVTDVFSHLR